jgi:uncharacterized protein YndB with AHSA1/START domain
MTLFFYLLIAFITFIAFLHAWAKKRYDISRTMVINAPRDVVFSYVRQLRKHPLWVPWFSKYPKTVLKHKGEDGKLGAAIYWKGENKEVGEGTQKIIKVKHPRVFETRVLFVKPVKVSMLTYFAAKELEPGKSKVVWGIRGNLPFPLSVMSLFYSPDRLMGKDIEKGLINLKARMENKVQV